MGRKVHPRGFRIGIIHDWQAKWYADKHYAEFLQEDLKLRRAIASRYAEAGISQVQIERQANEVSATIYTARPGVVIGRGGQRVDEMRDYLEGLIGKKVRLNILEIRQPELDAYLVARAIAEQIEHRIAYRRAMKQAIFRTMQSGAKGIRVNCAGRLGGAEIARTQTMHEGRVPLHTLRADIDYGLTEAHTTLGRIGVKVWIYKGDILPEPKLEKVEEIPAEVVAGEGAKIEPAEAVEPVEALAEPLAEKGAETVPSVEPEEKPKKPTRRRKKAEPEEKPTEPLAEKGVETVPSIEPEEKPKKLTRRRKKAEPEEKPAEPLAEKGAKTVPSLEPEEKPKKPTRRRKKTESTDSPSVKSEGQDATT
jgi:small subunit ribosomal protein S3